MDNIDFFNWSSEDGQKIIKEVSNRIKESKSECRLVNEKRFEELKERLKILLKKYETSEN